MDLCLCPAQKLRNGDPPLVQAWSSPLRIRLTAEGTALAARLYADAVQRCVLPSVSTRQMKAHDRRHADGSMLSGLQPEAQLAELRIQPCENKGGLLPLCTLADSG